MTGRRIVGESYAEPKANRLEIDAMTMRPTVLAHLTGKFSQHPELVVTEALGHVLTSSEPAKEALRAVLQSYGLDIGPVARVQTEVIGNEGERPDLVCFDTGGHERLLIEAKFWAGLTENQPVTYLRRLQEPRPSGLLVVAPSLRFEELWPELTRRVSQTDDIELGDTGMDRDIRWAYTGVHRLLIMASWRVLLDSLAVRTSAYGDIQAVNDIQQLQGLADLQDTEAFLPLRPEQLAPEAPRLIRDMIRIVDDASGRIFQTEWAARNRMQRRGEPGGLFQYMTVGGFNCWFGFGHEYWLKYGQTPLWFGFQQHEWNEREEDILLKIESLSLEDPPKYKELEGIIPIFVSTGTPYEAVLDNVVCQLKGIADLLQSQ